MVTEESDKDDLKDLKLTDKDIWRIVSKYCECPSPEYSMKYDRRYKSRFKQNIWRNDNE